MTVHKLIAAPVALQPGGYVKVAYEGRDKAPTTPSASMDLKPSGKGYRIGLQWKCPNPVQATGSNTDIWVDACAVLAPAAAGAQWITMGSEALPVEGALWRADREDLHAILAEGLGSVHRQAAPEGWSATSSWDRGVWSVTFELDAWSALTAHKQIALAVWRGDVQDRGGLKSVSEGWISTEP
jgi:DMSO reductase family type II enzyme heme b subunit